MPFPLPLETLVGKPLMFLIFGLIGFAFGFTLEISGFGNSKKLAAQFYVKDLTVLKVMFTAIVVAMVLLFSAIGVGLLDYGAIWVNPTYLWPGIVGGLIMGVGFIIGGFCPGTSLVAAATAKLDGIWFVLGGLFGIFLFGETEQYFDEWWNSSYFGRLTLMDVFGLPAGVVVVGVVFMALFMFWGAEQLERIVGGRDLAQEPKWRYGAAAALVAVAAFVLVVGYPTPERKWTWLAPQKEPALVNRQVQIHPGELLASQADDALRVMAIDVRPEQEYNLFHIRGAQNIPLGGLPAAIPELLTRKAANTVYVVMSNDEAAATAAWKLLSAESVPNVYILEGGINHWLATFGAADPAIRPTPAPSGYETINYTFPAALGDRYAASAPNPHTWEIEFLPKIKLQLQRDKSGGGCG
jgi:rhodanese-related sulfurtransferase